MTYVHNKMSTSTSSKRRKTHIPQTLRMTVFRRYYGPYSEGQCMCCSKNPVSIEHFVCSHVESENDGGQLKVENLRPTCDECSVHMTTQNMLIYMKDQHYPIPHNWNGYNTNYCCVLL